MLKMREGLRGLRAVSARWQLILGTLRVSVAPVPFRSLNSSSSWREGLSEE